MSRQPVVSSNVRSIGYDAERHVMEIEFHSGGVYQYHDVPPDVYREVMAARSVGQAVHMRIQTRYRVTKV